MRQTPTLLAACLLLPPSAHAAPAAITVIDRSGKAIPLTAADLAQLPSVHTVMPAPQDRPPGQTGYDGPSLWSVLTKFAAVTDAPRQNAGQAIRVDGADHYDAVLAMGEIAPGLEGKQVILADHQNGQPIPAGHLRLVIPADQHASRSVRDVTRISILTP
jgi:hypothetical protein